MRAAGLDVEVEDATLQEIQIQGRRAVYTEPAEQGEAG
jgi:hypothetical protein